MQGKSCQLSDFLNHVHTNVDVCSIFYSALLLWSTRRANTRPPAVLKITVTGNRRKYWRETSISNRGGRTGVIGEPDDINIHHFSITNTTCLEKCFLLVCGAKWSRKNDPMNG